MKLILFGGVHGVDKTTLLEYLSKIFVNNLQIFDPGIYFWKHLYELQDKSTLEIEDIVINELEKIKNTPTVICNWHYAVWTKDGYIPQLSYKNLERLIQTVKPSSITLILIKSPVIEIYKRRLADIKIKKRKIDIRCIEEEIEATDIATKEHINIATKWTKTKLIEIENVDLKKTEKIITKIMKSKILNK